MAESGSIAIARSALLSNGGIYRVAVALIFIKTRPQTMSTKSCIHHIRLHLDSMVENKLLSKANEGHPSGLAACLEAHRKCDSTISKLRDVISEQRREIHSLQEQAKPRRNLTPNANSGLKRKRVDDIDDHEPGSWDHSARTRAESALKASQADAARIRIVMDELGLFLPGRSVSHYLQCFYSLQQLLVQHNSTSEDLTSHITELCLTISTLLDEVQCSEPRAPNEQSQITSRSRAHSKPTFRDSTGRDNNSRLAIIGRTVIYLVKALSKLEKEAGAESSLGQAIYHIVAIFRKIIERIQRLSEEPVSATELPKGGSGKSKQLRDLSMAPAFDQGDARAGLGRLFITLLLAWDTETNHAKNVSEGAIYLLLNRAGTVLKTFVFDIAVQTWNQNSPSPTSTSQAKAIDQKLLAMQLESPYLVWILERALALVQRSPNKGPSVASSLDNNGDQHNLPGMQVQIQQTLLQAMFQDDTTSFADRLREPVLPSSVHELQIPVIGNGDIFDWYKREIWRIVGWQELRKHLC